MKPYVLLLGLLGCDRDASVVSTPMDAVPYKAGTPASNAPACDGVRGEVIEERYTPPTADIRPTYSFKVRTEDGRHATVAASGHIEASALHIDVGDIVCLSKHTDIGFVTGLSQGGYEVLEKGKGISNSPCPTLEELTVPEPVEGEQL